MSSSMPTPRLPSFWIVVLLISVASAFVIKKVMGIALFLCFLYAIWMLASKARQPLPQAWARLPLPVKGLIIVLCAPFVWVLLLGFLRGQQDLEQLTEYLSHLMAAVVLLVVYGKVKIEHWALFKGLVALACLVLLPMTLWEMPHPVWQERYATYFVDPNSLGIAGFIFGSALGVAVFQKGSWAEDARVFHLPVVLWVVLLSLGACSAWVVSILSGTRGAWLAVAPALVVMVSVSRNRLKVLTATLLLGGVGLGVASQTPMLVQRYQAAVVDLAQLQQGNRDTSLGTRLSIYEALISIAVDSPWLGMSRDEMKSRIRAHDNLSVLNKETLLESGAHNQYLEKQVLNGLPGLLAAILLYLVPLLWFWARLMPAPHPVAGQAEQRAWVYASGLGVIVCLAFATAGLSLVLTLKYLNTFWAACVALAAATTLSDHQVSVSDLPRGASHV